MDRTGRPRGGGVFSLNGIGCIVIVGAEAFKRFSFTHDPKLVRAPIVRENVFDFSPARVDSSKAA
jgi:hypothetical protein